MFCVQIPVLVHETLVHPGQEHQVNIKDQQIVLFITILNWFLYGKGNMSVGVDKLARAWCEKKLEE